MYVKGYICQLCWSPVKVSSVAFLSNNCKVIIMKSLCDMFYVESQNPAKHEVSLAIFASDDLHELQGLP